ncbi:MAG TPA: class I tRNA ligase family protein [Candidatus Paceibacterota bacterium]|nr:class I tRNA ligase family protein [Candidatus Paceibacterota bacterium]
MPANDEAKTDTGFNLPAKEEEVLKFWEEKHIFEKSLEKNKPEKAGAGKKNTFVFYEGPPYANGKPGIHHVLARIVKDVILRYKTMRGFYVPRKAGWDTHGLPVEMAAEKALGFKSKKDIEQYGVKRFNEKAKEQVWLYKDEWESMTRRIGYWLDLKNAYVTYEPEYIETLWWTLQKIWQNKLLYKGHKVVPWCTRCGTALSSHELAQGYKETTDNSVYVKFKLKSGQKIGDHTIKSKDKIYILSWTTTPWTLPGNVALAVGPNIQYRAVEQSGEYLIAAVDRLKDLGLDSAHVSREITGSQLVGLEYEPLFNIPALQKEKSYKIYPADFVTTTDGTGVVHTAVMYGEDDYRLGKKIGLPEHHTVDEEGKFTKDVSGLAGSYVKSKETEEKIFAHLEKDGNLLRKGAYTHEYPYCWRCGTPILYYARTSWFIAMSSLREKLLAANKKINWMPEHVKEGRFGEWLREVKDWNLSRERYWGAPLPIWECKKCGELEVIGGLDDLSAKAGGSKNSYWTMRHGFAENLIEKILDSGQKELHLTELGRDQVRRSAEALKKELASHKKKIDFIVASDVLRTKESAEIAAAVLGVPVEFDKRLREIHLGVFAGRHEGGWHKLFPTLESRFEGAPEGGETLRDLRARMWQAVTELEKKYNGKNILIMSHEYPIWMLTHAAEAWSEKRAIREKQDRGDDFVVPAAFGELRVKIVPRNDTGEVDLHRPFADDIPLPCKKCGGEMRRIKEVADVWYDSGAMPFAQDHYPFACVKNQKSEIRNPKPPEAYPADYIAEGMDQTRGWFYTLLAVATALGYEAPYKNVISLGLINDKFGQKMSKSKGNVVDPWAVIRKYGADAVRWYFYTANPLGEPKNFDELEILKSYRRMHLILWNSVAFWKTYASGGVGSEPPQSKNVLDQWILARLDEVAEEASARLEQYEIREAALAIESFVDDLSRWYIRRSRKRLQHSTDEVDFKSASATLGFVLRETTKLIAPFTPFFAESLYENFKERESVHLDSWPKAKGKIDAKLIEGMAEARRLASLGLAKRAELKLKVRQPLANMKIKSQVSSLKSQHDLLTILADEVNVKEVAFDEKIAGEVELDTTITPELKEEGLLREVARAVQGLRQEAGLAPKDKVAVMLELPVAAKNAVQKNEGAFKSDVGAASVSYGKSEKFDAEASTKVDGAEAWIGIRKV